VTVSSHTLSNGNPVKVGFSLSKPGTVRVKLLRTVNGKTKVVGTVTIYTLSLQTGKGKTTSKAVKTKLNVS
jgi:hypothetical protein